MPARNKRKVSAFSLSFLDIMSCGFGAAVLLFLIIKHNVDTQTSVPAPTDNQASEVTLLEEQIEDGRKNLAQIRNTISEVDDQLAQAQGLAKRIMQEKQKTQALTDEVVAEADTAELETIKAEIKKLALRNQQLKQEIRKSGEDSRRISGDGTRQYLTGLKINGRHLLILLDTSASMLDDTIVNVIRFRNMRDELKRNAQKWTRALDIVEWLTAKFPVDSKYQIYTFNTKAASILPETTGQWLDLRDRLQQDRAIENLRTMVPGQGTDLENAFVIAGQLQPRPDNIYLITDGLPTQGSKSFRGPTISGRDRVRLFSLALKKLPPHVPVNVILTPLEGDPEAASAYWRLAQLTEGSFMSPTQDWP